MTLRFPFPVTIEPSDARGYEITQRDGVTVITGRDVMAGAGRLLREGRPIEERSIPAFDVRSIYFAGHMGNWYSHAPDDELRAYLLEMALWGYNELCTVLEVRPGETFHDAWKRMSAFEDYARTLGMRADRPVEHELRQATGRLPRDAGPDRRRVRRPPLAARRARVARRGQANVRRHHASVRRDHAVAVRRRRLRVRPVRAVGRDVPRPVTRACRARGPRGDARVGVVLRALRVGRGRRVVLAPRLTARLVPARRGGHRGGALDVDPRPVPRPALPGHLDVRRRAVGPGAARTPRRVAGRANSPRAPPARRRDRHSEGRCDDLNKVVQAQLLWDPDRDVSSILREYATTYFGSPDAALLLEDIERGMDGLPDPERWRRGIFHPEWDDAAAAIDASGWRWDLIRARTRIERLCAERGWDELAVVYEDLQARLNLHDAERSLRTWITYRPRRRSKWRSHAPRRISTPRPDGHGVGSREVDPVLRDYLSPGRR